MTNNPPTPASPTPASPALTGVFVDNNRARPAWVALWKVGAHIVLNVPLPAFDAPITDDGDRGRARAEEYALSHPPNVNPHPHPSPITKEQ